jgi:prenyltransferase beta subunit
METSSSSSVQASQEQVRSLDVRKLSDRSQRISVLLESLFIRGATNPFEKTVVYLMQHQEENGAWGAADYPPWTDVITAFTLQVLTAFGFHENSEWIVTRSDSAHSYIGGVQKAIDCLVFNQQSNGRWGEDFFDTCQVLKALLPYRGKLDLEPPITKGLSYVRAQILANWAEESGGEWYGPGFFAAAIDVFNFLNETDTVNRLLELLYSTQDVTGPFCSAEKLAHESIDLCLWHTSLAVLSMHSLGIPSDATRLRSAVKWIESHQNSDGSWGLALARHRAVFTSYGIMAIAAINGIESAEVLKGIEWLKKQQTVDGRVGGHEGTIMAALAFSKVAPRAVTTSVPLNVVLDAQQLVREQVTAITTMAENSAKLQSELNAIRANLQDREVALKSAQDELGAQVARSHSS